MCKCIYVSSTAACNARQAFISHGMAAGVLAKGLLFRPTPPFERRVSALSPSHAKQETIMPG